MWYAFDLMGVLVKERHVIRRGLAPFLISLGVDVRYSDLKKLYSDYVVGKISEHEFHSVVPPHAEKEFLDSLELNHGAKRVLQALREKGYKTGVITNLPGPWARYLINRIGVEFDAVAISGEVGYKKPDARIYWVFLQMAGAEPEEVIFVDDRLENLETAQKIGMKTVFYSWINPDKVISDLEELLDRE